MCVCVFYLTCNQINYINIIIIIIDWTTKREDKIQNNNTKIKQKKEWMQCWLITVKFIDIYTENDYDDDDTLTLVY